MGQNRCWPVVVVHSPVFAFWFSVSETHLTHIRFFLSLRAAFFSSSSNISAISANCLLENEWGCIIDVDNRRPPFTCCAGRWLNTTESVNTDHSDGTKMERWRNGNVTRSVNRLLYTVLSLLWVNLLALQKKKRLYTYITQKCRRCDCQVNQLPCFLEKYLWLFLTRGFVFSCIYLQLQNNCLIKESTRSYSDWNYLYKGC